MRFDRPRREVPKDPAQAQAEYLAKRIDKVEHYASFGDASDEILRWFKSPWEELAPEVTAKLHDLAISGYRADAAREREYAAAPTNPKWSSAQAIERAEKFEDLAERLSKLEEPKHQELLEFLSSGLRSTAR